MYNQYLDGGGFVLLEPEPQGQPGGPPNQGQHRQSRPNQPYTGGPRRPPEPARPKNDLAGEVARGLGQLLDGVMKHFSPEHFDTGDILLVLIILFLYLEDGDNLELVITLALLLLLGLDGDKDKDKEA